MNPNGRCYEGDSNLKHVPLVNISGFTDILVLIISPGDNDLSALQRTLFAGMKNQKFKKHNNKSKTREEKSITKYKFGPKRV